MPAEATRKSAPGPKTLEPLVIRHEANGIETLAYAADIATKLPSAIRPGQSLLYRQADLPLEAAYQTAGDTMACNMMEPDARAGIDAFLNKTHTP